MPESYFEQRERALLGVRYDELYAPGSETPARGMTVNTLRCSPQRFAELARAAGFSVERSPFCENGLCVDGGPDFRPGRHPYHHAGVFYSQEPSASAPAPLLEVQPGMRVLDLCAAPGGKTSQLAAALQGKGVLVSNEPMPGRAEILRQNLERMGVTNAVVLNEQPARIAKALPEWFDRVLVDAPCSGEGMFRKEAEALRQHSEALVEQCAALGSEILESAAALLAPGGVLVYSTCTFAPQEDEGQIGAFLERHPEFELCSLETVGFGRSGEENRTCGHPFAARQCRRIWPADGGEGHFMAKLRKAGEPPHREETPARRTKPCKEWQTFAAAAFPQLEDEPVTALKELQLLNAALLPEAAAKKLHLLRSGVLAGAVQKGRFVPGHALFMAYGAQCPNREELKLEDPRVAAWLRGEEIPAETARDGWCAVLVDGFPLGCGKVSGGRVKNHYPKALRNLK